MIMKLRAAFVLALTIPAVIARLDGHDHEATTTTTTKMLKNNNLVVKKDAEGRDLSYYCYPNDPCDFDTLMPNYFYNSDLHYACGFYAYASKPINVFDSSDIKSKDPKDDPDLGSPNRNCKNKGPGVGSGGNPGSDYANCDALGNVLILQNPDITDRPNDDPHGGCFFFDMTEYIYTGYKMIYDIGLLDIEEGATIKLITAPDWSGYTQIDIGRGIVGNNGHWIASKHLGYDLSHYGYVYGVEICLNGSGAISFIQTCDY